MKAAKVVLLGLAMWALPVVAAAEEAVETVDDGWLGPIVGLVLCMCLLVAFHKRVVEG